MWSNISHSSGPSCRPCANPAIHHLWPSWKSSSILALAFKAQSFNNTYVGKHVWHDPRCWRWSSHLYGWCQFASLYGTLEAFGMFSALHSPLDSFAHDHNCRSTDRRCSNELICLLSYSELHWRCFATQNQAGFASFAGHVSILLSYCQWSFILNFVLPVTCMKLHTSATVFRDCQQTICIPM